MFRLPYLNMPLSIDTGYHVPPATVAQKRFVFRNPWASWAAGCSKAIPSWFYQLCYLVSPEHYRVVFRIGHGALYWITAAIMGRLVYEVGGSGLFAFIAFGLLSTEPHWGASYYEASESFHPIMQAGGLLLGILVHPALGVFVLACDAFFVKLSSAPTDGLLALVLLAMFPLQWAGMVAGGLLAIAGYMLWIRFNGSRPSGLIAVLRAQQDALKYNDHWTDRLYLKASMLFEVLYTHPMIPIAAVVGALHAPPVAFVWLAGTILQLFIQTNVVWYFAFPVIAPISILAGFAPEQVFYPAIAVWLVLWAYRALWDKDRIYRWAWKLHEEHAEKCYKIEQDIVSIKDFFVLGAETQFYVLHNGAYASPFVSGAWFLDYMFPGWTRHLNRTWLKRAPKWLVDTTDAFNPALLYEQTGLKYKLDDAQAASYYKYQGLEPRASAIISAYRGAARFLKTRIDNLLEQTEVPEIIVVCKAGSPEHTIALSYWDRIKIVATQDVPTIYKAWNLGIQIASGRFIFNANSDDRCHKEYVEIMADALVARPDAAIVYADSFIVSEETGQPVGRFDWAEGGIETLKEGCFLGPMPMWRASLHEKYGYFDEDMQSAGDYEFWLRLASEGEYFHHLRVILGWYMRRAQGAEWRDKPLNIKESQIAIDRYTK